MPTGKHGSNPPKEFTCQFCNKTFKRTVYPGSYTKSQFLFCSPACRNKGRKKDRYISCPICKKEFYQTSLGKQGTKRFCSKKCVFESFRQRPKHNLLTKKDVCDAIRTRYGKEGPDLIANEFGMKRTTIQNMAYQLNVKLDPDVFQKIVYETASQYMKERNPMFSEKTKQKVKEYWEKHPDEYAKRHEQFLEGQSRIMKDRPTGLENKFYQILDSLGVDYERQKIIKPKFIVDSAIGNLIVQADGEYWHGHPRFEPLTERQKSQQKRDHAQDKYLSKCGYKIERIWENDMSISTVIAVLQKHNIPYITGKGPGLARSIVTSN